MPWRMLRQIVRVGILTEPAPVVDASAAATSDAAQARSQSQTGEATEEAIGEAIRELHRDILALLGRALAIRAVDPGSCNGCELEIHALNNPYYNIEGLGIKFVASPRHADLLLVTGPVSAHMESALRRTYEAMPAPKRVVAVGECGCNGGVFGESYACRGRVANVLPVDVAVAGCPPAPLEILRGILRALR
ncbi:membrane-bound (NiFe)-hydrogenase (Ehf-type, Group 4f), small subunit F [Burkholderiales bacterium]|nr:membrane-bound (NiFe)-hydrogenase (Ehf-type, Group 4f), small subunit F [Burkholderiales bacterium]